MIDTRKGGWKENRRQRNGKRRTLMKKTFGKILGAFLCLGMVLGLMPSQALQVKAADEHKHCVCGATHKDVGDLMCRQMRRKCIVAGKCLMV